VRSIAKPKPEKKPATPASTTRRVVPMELRIGDRITAGTGGRTAYVGVRRVGRPDVTDIRMWGAHERVSMKRATAEEGKR
jgi:hypothetical protein